MRIGHLLTIVSALLLLAVSVAEAQEIHFGPFGERTGGLDPLEQQTCRKIP